MITSIAAITQEHVCNIFCLWSVIICVQILAKFYIVLGSTFMVSQSVSRSCFSSNIKPFQIDLPVTAWVL